MTFQTTVAKEVRAVGNGLHSGEPITVTIKPAPPKTGYVFVRTDLDGGSVKASIDSVDFERLQLATTLAAGDVSIQTTEHLLSALCASGVDNAVIEVDGPELPIMDGSASPFLFLIEEAGIKQQAVAASYLKIIKPFHFSHGDKRISVHPDKQFRISYEIEFDHPLIQRQNKTVVVNRSCYEHEIAPARTFGFLKDVNYLKSIGLIKGGSLENAILLDGDSMVNESLRQNDEFVSHKILDMIGDLAICGYRLQGHFVAYKAGHQAHAMFLKALLAARDCYEIVSEEQVVQAQPLSALIKAAV